jgi:hypothetical protein
MPFTGAALCSRAAVLTTSPAAAEPLVVRPQDRLDVLRVELLGPRREADEVGEEHGHDLALAPGLHGYFSRSTA